MGPKELVFLVPHLPLLSQFGFVGVVVSAFFGSIVWKLLVFFERNFRIYKSISSFSNSQLGVTFFLRGGSKYSSPCGSISAWVNYYLSFLLDILPYTHFFRNILPYTVTHDPRVSFWAGGPLSLRYVHELFGP